MADETHNTNAEIYAKRALASVAFWKHRRAGMIGSPEFHAEALWRRFLIGIFVLNVLSLLFHGWFFWGVNSEQFFVVETSRVASPEIVGTAELANTIRYIETREREHEALKSTLPDALSGFGDFNGAADTTETVE